jgi:hypothetical protein
MQVMERVEGVVQAGIRAQVVQAAKPKQTLEMAQPDPEAVVEVEAHLEHYQVVHTVQVLAAEQVYLEPAVQDLLALEAPRPTVVAVVVDPAELQEQTMIPESALQILAGHMAVVGRVYPKAVVP